MMERFKITWICDICGRERPDEKISVAKADISKKYFLPPGTATKNTKYCNDNPECAKAARER